MSSRRRPSVAFDLPVAVGPPAHANRHELVLHQLADDAYSRRPVADRAHDHHVRYRQRRGDLHHASGHDRRRPHPAGAAHRARALVLLHHVQVLDDDAALLRARLDDSTLLAAVLAGDDLDEVAAADSHGGHQRTSGASETIFMKLRSRSSRATGPKMRVPRGLFWASMITAAFSSKAIEVPSSRPNCFLVRTTTAVTTSPFLTAPWGVACLTVATIVSPTPA